MGYYIRILSPSLISASLDLLRATAADFGASLGGGVVTPEWAEVDIISRAGETLCTVERNGVHHGSLAEEEIAEFNEEVSEYFPKSAANWIKNYLRSVRNIYAFQIYNAASENDGWDVIHAVRAAIWNISGGIFQADGEGFSNEDGYHILWQFSPDVNGSWNMAVLEDGDWRAFNMDLGNPAHRLAFQRGEVPPNVAMPF